MMSIALYVMDLWFAGATPRDEVGASPKYSIGYRCFKMINLQIGVPIPALLVPIHQYTPCIVRQCLISYSRDAILRRRRGTPKKGGVTVWVWLQPSSSLRAQVTVQYHPFQNPYTHKIRHFQRPFRSVTVTSFRARQEASDFVKPVTVLCSDGNMSLQITVSVHSYISTMRHSVHGIFRKLQYSIVYHKAHGFRMKKVHGFRQILWYSRWPQVCVTRSPSTKNTFGMHGFS